jgi:4'-phosphopantetheinyl transferase
MTVHWLSLAAKSVPPGDDWLGDEERAIVSALRVPKRRADWRLGRYVSKRALIALGEIDRLNQAQILADDGGVPRAFVDGRPSRLHLSISHRGELGVCAIGPTKVGCDIELIEPRTSRFVEDFFTRDERQSIALAPEEKRTRFVALTWSAKESALKLLQVGLRRDTRSVEVTLESGSGRQWQPFRVWVVREQLVLHGWWRADHEAIVTVISESPDTGPPVALIAPADLD